MKKSTAPIGKDILINAAVVFLIVTVVGMISNVLILLVGWLTSMPVTASLDAQGYSEAESRVVWAVLGAVSMIACTASDFAVLRIVGSMAADFSESNRLGRRLNVPVMFVTVGLGIGVHAAVCFGLNALSVAYLTVVASPVQYIARFLGHGRHELFLEDAFDFDPIYLIYAILLYLLFITAAVLAAYVVGFTGRIRAIEKKEREDAATARWEARKAEREAYEKTNGPAESNWHKQEIRERLSPATEAKFRKLNRDKIVQTAVFIALWTAADVLIWWFWSVKSGQEMLSPSAIFFSMVLVVPFFPMKKHEVFLGKTYYAEVADVRKAEEAIASFGFGRSKKISNKVMYEVFLKPKGGVTEKLIFSDRDDRLRCKKGDYVLKLSAFKYPVNCNFELDDTIYCPNCGQNNAKTRKRCKQCGNKLAR